MLHRILRCENHKGLRQRVRAIVHRDLRFVHRLEQRRLRFRRGAIDFVGKNHVCEDRAGLEIKFLADLIENSDSDHIARK